MDPIQTFLKEKRGGIFSNAGQAPKLFGDALMSGAATAAAGGVMAGMGYGAAQLYNAATKGHDFRQMLMHNPDLVAEHEKDPKAFNQLFTSLRNVNPRFSKDPTIAGTYMRRMVGSPAAGGVLTDALGFRGKEEEGLGEAALTSGQAGIAASAKGFMTKQPFTPLGRQQEKLEKREVAGKLKNFDLQQKYDRKKLKAGP